MYREWRSEWRHVYQKVGCGQKRVWSVRRRCEDVGGATYWIIL